MVGEVLEVLQRSRLTLGTCGHSGQKTRARREPARIGRGSSCTVRAVAGQSTGGAELSIPPVFKWRGDTVNLLASGTRVGCVRKRIEVPETVFTRVFYAASQVLQETLGEPQPPWDELPAWQQHAMVDVTRRCMVGATPEQLHTLWVQHYSAHGWTYGPRKNWATRQHPIIISWHELPLRYQARFKLWQAMVATLMLETPEYSAVHSLIRS